MGGPGPAGGGGCDDMVKDPLLLFEQRAISNQRNENVYREARASFFTKNR
jgi:hypothetical protein